MRYIKRQLRFALEDIADNKLYWVIGLVQITIATLILCYVINLMTIASISLEKINVLKKEESVYGLKDNSSGQQFEELINGQDGLKELQKMYSQLSNNDKIRKTVLNGSQDISIANDSVDKNIIELAKGQNYDSVEFETLRITSDFFDFFSVNLEKNVKDKLFENDKNIVLGYDFKRFYNIGDKVKDNSNREYTVVGFLEKNSFYISPFEGKNAINLDNHIIISWKVDYEDSISLICDIKNSLYSDGNGSLQKIVDESNKSEFVSFKSVSLQNQIHQCIKDIENELITMITLGLIIMIFASVGIISYMAQYIENRYREFAINMICGAQVKDIVIRVILQMGLILIFAIAISVIAFGINFYTMCSCILIFIYGFGISKYLSIKIHETSIIQNVRNGGI